MRPSSGFSLIVVFLLIGSSSQRFLDSNLQVANQKAADYECGLPNSQSSRITGGSETFPNEFPWTANLELFSSSGASGTCTGTLINQQWILTAAHCIDGAINATIVLGAHDITTSDSNQQVFTVGAASMNSHPNFEFEVEDDIALIKLPRPVQINNYVRPACMPYSEDPDLVGEPVTMVGWGNYSSLVSSGSSSVLRSANTTVVDSSGTNGVCQQRTAKTFSGDKVICSESSNNRHYCYGDGGGPLNYYDSHWKTYTVVGVTGMNYEIRKCSSSSNSNVYARVRFYLPWIQDVTGVLPLPKPSTTTTTIRTTDKTITTTPTTLSNEFPWTANLQLFSSSGASARCTGTLINQQWILTAAHCIYDAITGIIVLGVDDITTSGSNQQVFTVGAASFNSHPNFQFGVEDDIGLIKLPRPVQINNYVKPASMSYSGDPDLVGERVAMVGWTTNSSLMSSGSSSVLRSANTTVVDSSGTNGVCQQRTADTFSGVKVICSESNNNRHYCHGDGGGPLNYYDSNRQIYTVVGVTGMNYESTNCCSSSKPNVYARVRFYLQWIQYVTSTTTPTTTTKPTTTFSCKGKPSGNYKNPASDCSNTFYMCSNEIVYLFNCADKTYYSETLSSCDFGYNIPACGMIQTS